MAWDLDDIVIDMLVLALSDERAIEHVEMRYSNKQVRSVSLEMTLTEHLPTRMYTTAIRKLLIKFFGLDDKTPANEVFERAMIWFGERGKLR